MGWWVQRLLDGKCVVSLNYKPSLFDKMSLQAKARVDSDLESLAVRCERYEQRESQGCSGSHNCSPTTAPFEP